MTRYGDGFHPEHPLCSLQVLGESMAGISMNCKNGDVSAFGDCVGSASRALCGLTEAAGQVEDAQANKSFLLSILFDDGSFSFFNFLTGGVPGWCV